MSVVYDDGQAVLRLGDVRAELAALASDSVHCVVTSPPYWGLRSYLGKGDPNKALELGSEQRLADYVAHLVEVFREIRRVLHASGTVWLNLGDSYYGAGGANNNPGLTGRPMPERAVADERDGPRVYSQRQAGNDSLKPKDLCMVPARVALALCDDGWWLRSEIVWCKQSCMPESVTDRPTSATERIYLLAKNERYFYDQWAIRVATTYPGRVVRRHNGTRVIAAADEVNDRRTAIGLAQHDTAIGATRNLWNYWTKSEVSDAWLLGPEPSSVAHYATFPTELARRCIALGSSEHGCCPQCLAPWRRVVERKANPSAVANSGEDRSGGAARTGNPQTSVGLHRNGGGVYGTATAVGWEPSCTCQAGPPIACTVLDPFVGSGTTCLVAKAMGRRSIGIDLSAKYLAIAADRCRQTSLLLPVAAEQVQEGVQGRLVGYPT